MKKIFVASLVVLAVFIAACATPAENPGRGPELTVQIPELFSPDLDDPNYRMTINIDVNHPVRIKDWSIAIQPRRRQDSAQAGQAAQPAAQRAEAPARERAEGEAPRRRRVFFEQEGTGNPPRAWQWDGKGTSGEMVQSAMDYRFSLIVNDVFENSTTYEGTISTGILVRREGDNLRIAVPDILFPPNSAEFRLLSEEDQRHNTRIIRLIARALTRFDGYRITVEGHANPTTPPGTAQRNSENTILRRISDERARAVIDSLVTNHSIARTRLTPLGVGGDRTVASWDDGEENWKNRRVEFLLQR